VILRIVIRWLIIAVAIGLTAALFSGIDIDGGFGTVLWVAVIFGLVNAILGPVVRFVTLPLVILTLGLFALVVNAGLFLLTDALTSKLDIDGFWPALGGALVVAIIVVVLEAALPAGPQP
jgi:putative membrane protein